MKLIIIFISTLHFANCYVYNLSNENDLIRYLKTDYEKAVSKLAYKVKIAQWNYAVDINNKEKEKKLNDANAKMEKWMRHVWDSKIKHLDVENYKHPEVRRLLGFMFYSTNSTFSEEDNKNLSKITNEMLQIYSIAKGCPYTNQNCSLAIDGLSFPLSLDNITDIDENIYGWLTNVDAIGPKMRPIYAQYVVLKNKDAISQGFANHAEVLQNIHEIPDLENEIDSIWEQIRPLYNELFTYLKFKHVELFGKDGNDGLLSYVSPVLTFYDLYVPYPNVTAIDITKELEAQNYTVLDLFETANDFYKSMGLRSTHVSYDTERGAMIKKPHDREVDCYPSSWDFGNRHDYRIKMCTELDLYNYQTVHHEMGHIEYFMQYQKKLYLFREAPSPALHEAIGDIMALAAVTPKHLNAIGLLPEDYENSMEASINALMELAMDKVLFMPSSLAADKWQWDVFRGAVNENEWNAHFWYYVQKYQKFKPPVKRSERDFDPGYINHIATGSDTLAYFIATILEFQIYKSLCIAAGEYDKYPLHECDFYGSKESGKLLARGMQAGRSKDWPKVLEMMTGENALNPAALIEYFQPLYEFLQDYNLKNSNI